MNKTFSSYFLQYLRLINFGGGGDSNKWSKYLEIKYGWPTCHIVITNAVIELCYQKHKTISIKYEYLVSKI